MERLILLCLLSPAIFAQPHKWIQESAKDPNDEPFLPIHPVYPYSPKLIKRGAEEGPTSQLTPELYAPKADAKESYSSSYSSSDDQKDAYYNPDYNPYPKDSAPASAYPSYYGDAYAYVNSPYAVYNSYPSPYTVNPASYPAPAYPNYYYQQPYYYPHYYNHALFPPPPPPQPAQSGIDYHGTPQDSAEVEDDKQNKGGKPSEKSKESETNQDAPSASQYVDSGNYLPGSNTRDLDVQSSTYKLASPYNQLEQNVQGRILPIPLPKTTYRVISVAGQPVGPDYPLPASYVKAQQLETQLMRQTLTKLLAQQQPGQSSYESGKDTTNAANDPSYASQDAYDPNAPSYVTLPTVRTKPIIAYVISTGGTGKVNGGRASPPSTSSSQRSKNVKYSRVHYTRKPASQATTLEQSRTESAQHQVTDGRADQTSEYGGHEAPQSYAAAGTYTQPAAGDKQQPNYGAYQSQSGAYQSEDFTVTPQTPPTYSFQYSAYTPDQPQQPQSQEGKVAAAPSDDSSFGAKQYNKG